MTYQQQSIWVCCAIAPLLPPPLYVVIAKSVRVFPGQYFFCQQNLRYFNIGKILTIPHAVG
jgi:hypothetical protein